jgi:sugar phosphate isomerase/epimerase
MDRNEPIFSVSQYTTFPQTFEEDVELYCRLGLDGIELCEEKLAPDPGNAHEQLARLRDSGLKVTSVQPAVLSLFPHNQDTPASPRTPADRMERYRRTMDLVADSFPGESIPLIVGGGKAPDFNFRLAHRTARELLPPLADYAADRGLRLMFEPLNPILMNAFTFVGSLEEAVRLIEDVARPNFGLALDVWHVWRERGVVKRLAELGERIFGVHVCDWPKTEPRHLGDRALPGDGMIDLPSLLGAIDQSGYRGAYCLEIFSDEDLPDSLWRRDPAEVIRRGREGFLAAWRDRLGEAEE